MLLLYDSLYKEIDLEIKTFCQTNATGQVSPAIVWDTHKAVLWGNFILSASNLKRKNRQQKEELLAHIKELEFKDKATGNKQIYKKHQTEQKALEMLETANPK